MMKRIILDVDNVLNSLTLHIARHYGAVIGPHEYEKYPTDVGYDIILGILRLKGDCPTDEAEFWDDVTHADLWRSAPKSQECTWLVNAASDMVGRDNVYLATTPTKDPQSHADKLHWIWDNLPGWIHRQYFITPRKWLLGKAGTVLIDDYQDNCDRFDAEGGESILVPRPWNCDYGEGNARDVIECSLASIQTGDTP